MKLHKSYFALLTLLSLFSSCAKIQEPVFKQLQGFKVSNIGLQKADISFNVVYHNPNNYGVSVKEAVMDVYVDSVLMGRFIQPSLVQVDKKADFTIPLSGSVDVAKALKLKVGNVLDKEIQLSANGSVRIGKGGLFISQPIKYSGKHKLNLGI